MKFKTSDLSGIFLNYAVALCQDKHTGIPGYWSRSVIDRAGEQTPSPWQYPTNWADGGPIIEREGIDLYWMQHGTPQFGPSWKARIVRTDQNQMLLGPTPLIAAMRCYVTSKLGDEVDIPEELLL